MWVCVWVALRVELCGVVGARRGAMLRVVVCACIVVWRVACVACRACVVAGVRTRL